MMCTVPICVQMKGRGLVDGLAVGFAIAIPSGVGVALSILGNNTSSLVGVAISASLLPPAVNCGLAFAYAAMGFQLDSGARLDDDDIDYTTPSSFVHMGGISLALTIVNIGAIYVSGLVMFKVKEVAPIKNKTAFWQRDIKVSRRINTAMHKHGQYGMGVDRAQSIAMLQGGLKQGGLNPDMRQELRRLRRGQSMHELLSTSTIRSPHVVAEPTRPHLLDIFGVLDKEDAKSDDDDDDDDGDTYQDAGRSVLEKTPSPNKRPYRGRHTPSPSSARKHAGDALHTPLGKNDEASRYKVGPEDAYLVDSLEDIKKRFRMQGRSKSFTNLSSA